MQVISLEELSNGCEAYAAQEFGLFLVCARKGTVCFCYVMYDRRNLSVELEHSILCCRIMASESVAVDTFAAFVGAWLPTDSVQVCILL